MERTQFITHRGVPVLVVDLAGIRTLEELESAGESVSRVIRAEPPDSLRLLIDLTGTPYNLRVVRTLGEMAGANAAHVRARAVIGVPRAAGDAVAAIAGYTRRPVETFADRDAALEWLAGQ